MVKKEKDSKQCFVVKPEEVVAVLKYFYFFHPHRRHNFSPARRNPDEVPHPAKCRTHTISWQNAFLIIPQQPHQNLKSKLSKLIVL